MIIRLLSVLLMILSSVAASAHYTVHNVVGNVTVESGGKSSALTKGMTLKPTDQIVIPSGGKVEILNTVDKRIYSSIKTGKTSVRRLLIDARGVASDNSANVASRMQLGRKEPKGDQKVYVEKGMVRRSLAVYDPEGDGMELDAATLGACLAGLIKEGKLVSADESPVTLTSERLRDGGLGFKVENTLSFPVYFNIIRLKGDGVLEISPLGQPAGSYVLLPRQTMSREHFPAIRQEEKHLIIMANCQYDIDRVIEEAQKALQNGTASDRAGDLPVFVTTL